MADTARLIISVRDKQLNEAVPYYRAFPHEPSPAGELMFKPRDIKPIEDLTVERILDQIIDMPRAMPLVVVCHGTQKALLLPLVTGRPSLKAEDWCRLLPVARALDTAQTLRRRPTRTEKERKDATDAWFEILTEAMKESDLEADSLALVTRRLEDVEMWLRQWLDGVARIFGSSGFSVGRGPGHRSESRWRS
jgi:hypothetical protein